MNVRLTYDPATKTYSGFVCGERVKTDDLSLLDLSDSFGISRFEMVRFLAEARKNAKR